MCVVVCVSQCMHLSVCCVTNSVGRAGSMADWLLVMNLWPLITSRSGRAEGWARRRRATPAVPHTNITPQSSLFVSQTAVHNILCVFSLRCCSVCALSRRAIRWRLMFSPSVHPWEPMNQIGLKQVEVSFLKYNSTWNLNLVFKAIAIYLKITVLSTV